MYGVWIKQVGSEGIKAGERIVLDYEQHTIAVTLFAPIGWLVGEPNQYGYETDVLKYPKLSR